MYLPAKSSDALNVGGQEKFSLLAKTIDNTIRDGRTHPWITTVSYRTALKYTVSPYSTITVSASYPMYEVTGVIAIKIGDSTIYLDGLKFDTPIANGEPQLIYTITPATIEQSDTADRDTSTTTSSA
jgi:hypothetical protein